jgi:hypothetical protein
LADEAVELEVDDAGTVVVPETIVDPAFAVLDVVVMFVSSNADVDAAA